LLFREILVLGGWQDAVATIESHVLPFVRALQQSKAMHMTPVMLDAKHNFKDKRTELRCTITIWLRNQKIN
jgi:hypothetical protein